MLNITHDNPKTKSSTSQPALFAATNVNEVRRIKAWIEAKIKAASKLPPNVLLSDSFEVTPAQAEYLLATYNKGNRPLRVKRVADYARAIAEGRFVFTSQGISFSRNGLLNNGQHRLHAIVRAGRPVLLFFVFGEERQVLTVLDTGTDRNGSDALAMLDQKHTKTLAAAARLLANLEQGVFSNKQIDNDELEDLVMRRHPGLADAAKDGQRVGSRFKASVAAPTLAIYLIRKHSAHPERLDKFIEDLLPGNARPGSPIMRLRDGLQKGDIGQHVKGTSLKAFAQAAAFIRAWNLTLRGAIRGNLTWSPDQPFPTAE